MKKSVMVSLFFLAGCSPLWVNTPAPAVPLDMQSAALANGSLEPQNFYFTLISEYQEPQQARVVILTNPALKLADLTVSKTQLQVHYRAPKISGPFIRALGQLVREQFLLPCPARQIRQKAQGINGTFELEVTGGICL